MLGKINLEEDQLLPSLKCAVYSFDFEDWTLGFFGSSQRRPN